jgi:hypothetical protein
MDSELFTRNEVVALMHDDTAAALKRIADFIEKYKMDWPESVQLLREISDEKDAQAIVVRLRDELNSKE